MSVFSQGALVLTVHVAVFTVPLCQKKFTYWRGLKKKQ